MKKILTILLILLLSSICSAGRVQQAHKAVIAAKNGAGGAACVGDTCTGFLRCQNFEGTGYDNSETWNKYSSGGGGSIDEDSTSSPLRGSQSVVMYAGTSGNLSWLYNTLASTITSGNAFFKFSTDDYTPSSESVIAAFRNTSGNDSISILLRADGTLKAVHGSSSANGTTTISGPVFIWFDFVNGATDGTMNVYLSSTRTKPASPEITLSNGTNNIALDRFGFWAQTTLTNKFDQLLIDDQAIGTVCE